MKFTFAHNNFNVIDLDKSLKFYEEALGLKEVRRKEAADGSFILVYLGDATTGYQLELTWLRDRKEPYNLGETGRRTPTTWATMSSIWHLRRKTWRRHMPNIRKWDASVLKIRRWVFISLTIRMDTGWRSCRRRGVKG